MTPSNEFSTRGIDISHWQGEIDWAAVKHSGITFAFMKATDGHGFVDKRFSENWTRSKAEGLLRGAYHFFQPTIDPREQASLFAESVDLDADDLPPVLDLEHHDKVTSANLIQGAKTWLSEVQNRLGRTPIIYTGPSFWNTFMKNRLGQAPPWTAEHPLWIAHYTQLPQPIIPKGWSRWTFWQHTDRGSVDGIKAQVDMDWFNGGLDDLQEFVGTGALAETRIYTVQEEDTLEELALSSGVELEALLASNPGLIREGMELTIPLDSGSAEVPRERNYVVAAGDTLTDIALRFGTTVDELVRLNQIQNPDIIEAGQELQIF